MASSGIRRNYRLPVGWLYRWVSCDAERSSPFLLPISPLVGCSLGPTQHSSTQFGMLRLLPASHLASSLLLAGHELSQVSPHWMALAIAICRYSPKLSLWSHCTPKYLILFFYTTSCLPRTLRILKRSPVFVFSGAIFRPLLVPAGRLMRGKSSYMTFFTNGPTHNPWGAQHVISSLRDHFVALVYHPPVT